MTFIENLLQLSSARALRYSWLFIFLFTALQLAVITFGPLGLAPDEAHYWEWSRHLDLGYYSKGPLIALIIAGSTALFGNSVFAVRFPSVVLSFLLSVAILIFFNRRFGAQLALLGLIVFRSSLFFFSLGLLTTTDPPALLFAFLALWAGAEALWGREYCWLLFGLAVGIGALAKFTILILIPSAVIFLLFTPALRHTLWRPAFLSGCALTAFCLLPLLIWNSMHGWVTFQHNAAHLLKGSSSLLHLKHLAELVLGQFGLIGLLLFPGVIYLFQRGYRCWRAGDEVAGFFFCSGAPLAFLCLLISLNKNVYANWPMPLYLSALLLWAQLSSKKALPLPTPIFLKRALLINAFLIFLSLPLFFGFTYGLPGRMLPTKKLIGWDALAQRVAFELKRIKGHQPFLVTYNYDSASAISFYTPGNPFVYCATVDARRMNQYDLWGGWEKLRSRPALLILKTAEVPAELAQNFRKVRRVDPPLQIFVSSDVLQTYYFFYARSFNGTPPNIPSRR